MPTFAEIQQHLYNVRFKRLILNYLVEHIDAEFMPTLDQAPKKALLTEEKLRVPREAFEEVAADISKSIKALMDMEQEILGAGYAPQAVPPQQAQ
jgi:hypothetical protein